MGLFLCASSESSRVLELASFSSYGKFMSLWSQVTKHNLSLRLDSAKYLSTSPRLLLRNMSPASQLTRTQNYLCPRKENALCLKHKAFSFLSIVTLRRIELRFLG